MCRGALPRTRGAIQSCGPPADSPMWWELDTDNHPGFRDPNTQHPAVVASSQLSCCIVTVLCLPVSVSPPLPQSLCLWVWVNVPPPPQPPYPPLLPALPALSRCTGRALRPPSPAPPRRGGPAGGAAGDLGMWRGGEAGRRGGGAAGRAAAASGPVAMGPEAAQAAAAAQTKARAARRARGVGAAGRTRLRRDTHGEPSRQGEPGQPRRRAGAGGPEVPGPGEGAGSPEVLDTEAEGGPGSSDAPGLAGAQGPKFRSSGREGDSESCPKFLAPPRRRLRRCLRSSRPGEGAKGPRDPGPGHGRGQRVPKVQESGRRGGSPKLWAWGWRRQIIWSRSSGPGSGSSRGSWSPEVGDRIFRSCGTHWAPHS